MGASTRLRNFGRKPVSLVPSSSASKILSVLGCNAHQLCVVVLRGDCWEQTRTIAISSPSVCWKFGIGASCISRIAKSGTGSRKDRGDT